MDERGVEPAGQRGPERRDAEVDGDVAGAVGGRQPEDAECAGNALPAMVTGQKERIGPCVVHPHDR